MKRWFVMLIVCALAALTFAAQAPSAGAAGTGQFEVGSDGVIRDPSGAEFVPIGANVGTQGSFDWRGDALGQSSWAVGWGWNTIRLDLYYSDSPTALTPAFVKDRAQQIINEYTAKGIVVILAHGWNCLNSGQFSFSNPVTSTNCPEPFRWMHDLAISNNTNPYVWFNCVNEPQADGAAWVNLQKACIDSVRSAWNNNLVVADAPGFADDPNSGQKRMFEPSMGPAVKAYNSRVVFDHHNYTTHCDNASLYTYLINMRAKGLATIIGEFGYTWPSPDMWDARNKPCTDANFAIAPGMRAGLLAWHGTMGDGYYLAQNTAWYGWVTRTPFGEQLYAAGHH